MAIESLSGKSLHIYLISTTDSLWHAMAELLKGSKSFRFSHAPDAMEMLSHADLRPDIVFIEPADTRDFTEIMRNLVSRLPDSPVVAVHHDDELSDIDVMEASGVSACVQTPMSERNLRVALRTAERIHALRQQVRQLQATVAGEVKLEQIVARTSVMHNISSLVRKACGNDINVLIEGEEGTGKEFFARVIHYNSARAGAPFVMLSCKAIPQHLIGHELFGSEPGALGEGSELKPGAIEQAEGGTLFIDEVGEMDTTLQARLYRCIQSRTCRRIGGEEDLPFNVRIVTATSMDLRAMTADGRFRDDLYFRLASFPIRLPALRDRVADIPALVEQFLRRYAEARGRPGIGISAETLQVLRRYRWPGNLPELEEVIERAVSVCERMEIHNEDLPHALLVATGVREAAEADAASGRQSVQTMDQLKARAVRLALEASGGNIKEAARLLDIGRTTIYKLIERYKIPT